MKYYIRLLCGLSLRWEERIDTCDQFSQRCDMDFFVLYYGMGTSVPCLLLPIVSSVFQSTNSTMELTILKPIQIDLYIISYK
jgi:hypothetical protein